MSGAIEFVKGHCGWDVVTLIPEGQIPPEEELATSIKILNAPIDGGLEVGWLGHSNLEDEIRLRMVNSTTKYWIPMCGGMSQVIGKALVETFLRDRFHVDTSDTVLERTLLTECGLIPIKVDIQDRRAVRVTTTMDSYLTYLYRRGIETMNIQGVEILRVGDYAIIDLAALESVHPNCDFCRRDPGRHLDIVNDILHAFRARLGLGGVNGMLYDDRAEGAGQYRVFPRFYSEDLAAARIPWEFQCGTGSMAVAVALTQARRLPSASRQHGILIEWGSYRATMDPYGIRTSQIDLKVDGNRVAAASFSHSVVEILGEGILRLPAY